MSITPSTAAYGGASPIPTTVNTNPLSQNITNLGLRCAIAVALGFLILVSTILLASYVCCRPNRHRNFQNPNPTTTTTAADGVILPRIIFVAEDEADENTVIGLDQIVINSYPKFTYANSKDRIIGSNSDSDSACSICLCEYREAEMVKMMPDCKHYFHLSCFDAWLKLNGSCPICRNSPLPTPLSTPLSELVPL